jgi:hypothetical protein
MKFVDFCFNDIVPKSQIDFLARLNIQPRKGFLPFRYTMIIISHACVQNQGLYIKVLVFFDKFLTNLFTV